MLHNAPRTRLLSRLGFWLALLGCTYLAFAPPPANPAFHVSDLVTHAFAFSVLTFGLLIAYHHNRQWLALALMLGYGIGIELVQGFLPTRSAEVKDVLVDVVGIGVGFGLFRLCGGWLAGFCGRLIG